MEELVGFSRDGEDEVLGGSAIFRDKISFAGGGEIESELTFAKGVAGDNAAVGAGLNVGFVSRKGIARDHAVEGVDDQCGTRLIMECIVEALESSRLVDLHGVAVFLEVTTGDAGGLIERGDIGGPAVVDACLGKTENIELIDVDSGAFGDLDAADRFPSSIESRGP